MKALVTGGAGFIGSHIAQALCRRGASVIVLDNLSGGTLDNLSWKGSADNLSFVEGDIASEKLVRDLVRGCDWVFHHAAIASVPASVAEPEKTNQQNLDASLQLLARSKEAGVKRFMFASSSAVYGETGPAKNRETQAAAPLSPYGLQKYAAESYCRLFHQLYGFETVSFRYFNVFGPRQAANSPYSGVIAKFCQAALRGQDPIIFGDGLQSRDFVYVENVVQANLLAAEAPAEKAAGRVFNIAGGQSVTLLQLVTELGRITGRPAQPRFEAARSGDVRFSEADISAAAAQLGYAPKVSWTEGLKRTLDFYRLSS